MEENTASIRNDAAMATAVLGLGLLLAFAGHVLLPRRPERVGHQEVAFDDLLGIGSTIAGLLIVVWWLSSFLLALAGAILHTSGRRHGANATTKLSPAFMRRLAAALIGLNLLGIPLANAAGVRADAALDPSSGKYPSIGISAQWAPASVPTPRQSDSPSGENEALGLEPRWQPAAPFVETGLLGSQPRRLNEQPSIPAQTSAPVGNPVVVSRGDSLWSIAVRHLGPVASDVDVALHWPKWYAANRAVIGDDPGLLVPGQILQPPPAH
ncbi:LysM peptidoglycan-binding domain-containing protein [bacterium RCC_150]